MSRHSELHHTYRRRATRLTDAAVALAEIQQLLIDAHNGAQLMITSTASRSTGETVSGGETIHKNTPTEAAMFARAWALDALDVVDEQLDDLLDPITGVVVTIRTELTKLAAAGRQATATEATPRTNMVDCTACGRTITMTPTDRPRGGYCNGCDSAWRRQVNAHVGPGAPDRAVFERARARWSELDDEPLEVRSVIGEMQVTRGGVTLTLTPGQMAHLLAFGPTPPEAEIEKLFTSER